jgi:branched-chain amino acid transport system substrate-binding protein
MSEDHKINSSMMVTRRSILAGAGAAAGIVAMPTILRAQSNEILLGALIALTGPNSAWGQRTWRGFQLACDLVNQQGGVAALGGAKLKYVVADTESKPELATSQVEKLIRQGAVAIIGTNQSPASIVATQITEQAKVPFVTATDADPIITSRGFKYVFRTSPTVERFIEDLLKSIRAAADAAGDKPTKLAILSENTITGQSSVKITRALAGKYGFELVEAANYDATRTQNFTPYIAKYKGQGVEVMIGHNRPNDAILITRTMRELNFNPKAYGGIIGGHVSNEYIDALGATADNVLVSAPWSGDVNIPGLDKISQAYQSRFQEPLDGTGAGGIISLSAIWSGLEKAASADRTKLRDALAQLDAPSADRMLIQPGGLKFDETGENVKASGVVMQIKNKTFVTVAPGEVAKSKMVYPKPEWQS